MMIHEWWSMNDDDDDDIGKGKARVQGAWSGDSKDDSSPEGNALGGSDHSDKWAGSSKGAARNKLDISEASTCTNRNT